MERWHEALTQIEAAGLALQTPSNDLDELDPVINHVLTLLIEQQPDCHGTLSYGVIFPLFLVIKRVRDEFSLEDIPCSANFRSARSVSLYQIGSAMVRAAQELTERPHPTTVLMHLNLVSAAVVGATRDLRLLETKGARAPEAVAL
ncbi:MAG: hypothetical protein HY340_00575 [Candidatus Kerfeldbacteria bacterium]|nr:hypothetical protein [Candidatus Kerfeldbacteria bacterium]